MGVILCRTCYKVIVQVMQKCGKKKVIAFKLELYLLALFLGQVLKILKNLIGF